MFRWPGKRVAQPQSRVGGRAFGRATGKPEWSRGQRLALRLGRAVLSFALVAALLYLAGRIYLVKSGIFTLKHIEIQTGETLRADLVSDYLKLTQGSPLFELDIKRRRDDFVRNTPTVRELTIIRRLPDRIAVRIVEREPLVRFARRPLTADAEGVVFVRYAGIDLLPVITGFDGLSVEPGARVTGMVRAAVVLIETLRIENFALAVVEIDVAHEDYIACTMSDQRRAKIAWEGMGVDTENARLQLRKQLAGLANAMNTDRGRARARWDATVAGRVYAL